MSSIRQRDGKYQVRIIRKGHRALARTFNNRTDAIKWARQTEVELERGAIQTHTRSITLADAITRYRQERTPHKKSARSEHYLLDAWAKSPLSSAQLSRIKPNEIAEWRDARIASGAAAQTVRNGLTVLSAIFEQAIREWGFDHMNNPVRRIRRPSAPRGRVRRVSQEEVEAIIRHTKSKSLPAIITLALATGMRLSEIALMNWENVDFHHKTLFLPDTKNGDARTVPLSTTAINTLLALSKTRSTLTSRRVFDISPHAVTVCFRRAARRARVAYVAKQAQQGMPDAGLFCNLRLHDLRHEAVSRLFEKGLNTIEVGTISGHKTVQTLKRYAHLRAADLVGKLG